MKKFAIFLFTILTICMAHTAYANKFPKIYANSDIIEFDEISGTPYFDETSRTMVPLRKAMESIGVSVTWKPENRTVVLKKDSKILILTLNSNIIKTSDNKTLISDTPAVAKDNRIYLPIRIVAQEFGARVLWNGQLSSVFLLTDEYETFSDTFVYDGELSKYANVDTVVVRATYSGDMSEDEFEKFWMGYTDAQIETYLKEIATDKKAINPEYEILINFFYKANDGNARDPYLGSVSSYSFDARRYNPFEKKEINNLN